jgi:hypothetical protein
MRDRRKHYFRTALDIKTLRESQPLGEAFPKISIQLEKPSSLLASTVVY